MRFNGRVYTVGADIKEDIAVSTQKTPEEIPAPAKNGNGNGNGAPKPIIPFMDRELIPGIKNRYLVIGGAGIGLLALLSS